jgi:hypothetical protein
MHVSLGRKVWSLPSSQPETDLVPAGTVARPTVIFKIQGFVGSATVPTIKTPRGR